MTQKKENQQLSFEIKERVRILAETSTLHGLSKIAKANTKCKLTLWLTFFLISVSLFATMAGQNIGEYYSWPVTTRIQFFNQKNIDFPGVAICNSNPFVTDEGVKFLLEFSRNYSGNSTLDLDGMNELLLNESIRYTIVNFVQFNISQSSQKKFGLPIEKFLISCRYPGEKCHHSNWTWFYSWNNGNCFKLNEKPRLKVSSVNKEYGLTVELFVGDEEKFPFFQRTNGFQIFIFNQTKYLKRDEYIPRISIKPGNEVNIEIKRRFVHKLPKPYSECEIDLREATVNSVDSDLYRETFLTNYSYEQFFCLHRAYRKSVYEKCKCIVEQSDIKEEAKICSTKEEQACRIEIDLVDYQIKKFDGKFDKDCPLECNVNELDTFLSSESFPSFAYGKWLLENNINFKGSDRTYSLNDLRRSVARINFYFTKIGHETLEEKPSMTVVNVLANTGGMLGLFLGMSLLTLIEGVQLLIEIFSLIFSKISLKYF